MRGSKDRNIKKKKKKNQTSLYFHNCVHSFSSSNVVISGVWERCGAARINTGSLGNSPQTMFHRNTHRVPSVCGESWVWVCAVPRYRKRTLAGPLVTRHQKCTTMTFLLLCACLANDSTCCGWMGAARGGINKVLSATRWVTLSYREGGGENQWCVRDKNMACQVWRNAAAREVEA